MASPLPIQPTVNHTPEPSTVFDITGEQSEVVFKALSSDTARSIFASLSEEPQTVSDLADRVDTSMQNVQYHIKRLVEADLVEPVDTWYSVKGREMNVYAVTAEELVLQSGSIDEVTPRQPLEASP